MKRALQRIVDENGDLVEQAFIDGLAAQPPYSAPYLKVALEYDVGRPVGEFRAEEPTALRIVLSRPVGTDSIAERRQAQPIRTPWLVQDEHGQEYEVVELPEATRCPAGKPHTVKAEKRPPGRTAACGARSVAPAVGAVAKDVVCGGCGPREVHPDWRGIPID